MLLRGYIWSLKQQLQSEFGSDDAITPLHGTILTRELIKFYDKYDKVKNFTEAYREVDVLSKEMNYNGSTIKTGMYLGALCDGITEIEMLFTSDLNKLEQAIIFKKCVPEISLVDSTNGCAYTFSAIAKMHSTYSHIDKIIELIIENNLSGCVILDICLKCRYSFSEETYRILLKYLNRPLLKQVTSWIVYGILEDPRDEFFIKHVDSVNPGISGRETCLSSASVPSNTPTSEMPEDIFEIDIHYLPSHVPHSLATQVLNTGKLVSLLRLAPSETESLPALQNGDFGINETEILKTMKDLEQFDNHHLSKVEKVVNLVWTSVNKQLKKLAEEVGGMFSQHTMLMDIFLMQRGEVMSNFVKFALLTFKSDAKKTSNHTLNLALRNAINNVNVNLISYLDHLSFALPSKNIVPDGTPCISVLELRYKRPWPLNFIFTTEVIQKYNIIFRFLLELKIARLNLQQISKDHSGVSPVFVKGVTIVKAKLHQLFANLESYIFVDIIQAEYETWEKAVKNAQTFNDIKIGHMAFLFNILRNLFLIHDAEKNNQNEKRRSVTDLVLGRMIVKEKIDEIFTISNKFCDALNNSDNSQLNNLLRNINSNLNDLVKSIIRIIHNTYKENDPPMSLYLRLNYNNFYSSL